MRMQEDLHEAKQWFEKNALKLNQQKTEVLTFEMDRWEKTGPAVRLLGIYIDPRLTWRDHIEWLRTSLARATYAVRRINQTVDWQTARTAYFALFMPV